MTHTRLVRRHVYATWWFDSTNFHQTMAAGSMNARPNNKGSNPWLPPNNGLIQLIGQMVYRSSRKVAGISCEK